MKILTWENGQKTIRDALPGELPDPLTPEEIEAKRQAEIDALTDQITQGRSIIRALGVKVFQIEKAANPDLTAAQFRQSVRAIIEGF